MKFGKILNREKIASRVSRKDESQNQVKVTEERFSPKSNDVSVIPDFSRVTSPRGSIPEAYQENPDQPGHLRLEPRDSPGEFTAPNLPSNHSNRIWETSHFSETTGSNHTLDSQMHLPPLQINNEHEVLARGLGPLPEDVVDPDGFDLAPSPRLSWEKPEMYSQERKSLLMFSKIHMRIVFQDLKLLRKFSAFLVEHRPDSVSLLVYHLDTRKALAAIKYTNALAASLKPLDGLDFTREVAPNTANEVLRRKAEASFERLANEDLPAWITSVWMKAVEVSIRRRINGSLPSQLRDMSEGLAETFVLSDPARYDNPILFASEEFNKMTQYSNKYIIGRNCRIFQGPRTDPNAIRRVREKLANAEQHFELMINYRRDGSPFEVLLMITPLVDARGRIRYYLGAQVDVAGLLNDFYGFEHLHKYFDRDGYTIDPSDNEEGVGGFEGQDEPQKTELQELSELFNHDELDIVRKYGGRLHHPDLQEPSVGWRKKQRLVIPASYDRAEGAISSPKRLNSVDGPKASLDGDETIHPGETRNGDGKLTKIDTSGRDEHDASHIMSPGSDPSFLSESNLHSAYASFDAQQGGHLGGVYDHYLLVRPAPYLRILFASPSLRIPGMVQSSLMERIGGSPQLRTQVEQAMEQGQSVTAKVKWMNPAPTTIKLSQAGWTQGGRNRWIHATPLLGRNGEVGVWMVVLVDDEKENVRRPRSSVASSVQEIIRSSGRQERKESVGFSGTDAGSLFQPEADRDLADGVPDGLRPPPGNGVRRTYD